jgi:hypothetical protein
MSTGAHGPAPTDVRLDERLATWEDLLTLVVDPDSPRVPDHARKRRMLSFLLHRAGLDEAAFWRMQRGQRGRLFLSRWSRVSRDVPQLEITSFDVDKVLKERFRQEPLTLGAAWHYGFWRSYFSHAAITHPANDGLREEFSTAWDIVRKHPAVVFRTAEGKSLGALTGVRLDLPMIVGPLPHSDGVTMERAFLAASAGADPKADLHTRTLVVVEADAWIAHRDVYRGFAADVMPRLRSEHIARLERGDGGGGGLGQLLAGTRIVELAWSPELARDAERVRAACPHVLVSVWMRYAGEGGDAATEAATPPDFWAALEDAARLDGVAMVH